MLELSIADQSMISAGGNATGALQETLDMALAAEQLGYHRFWLTEHHNMPIIASAAPEILIDRVASVTTRIRVGAGGIMLPNHSSIKVAESFRLLEALHPGRIDLGLGRAAGTDPYTARLINPSNDFKEENFPRKVEELQAFFADAAMTSRGPVLAVPRINTMPQQWILTGGANASVAAQWGLGLSLPHFITPVENTEGVERYRREFSPSGSFPQSRVSMGLFVICAESEEKAELLQKAILMTFTSLVLHGRFQPIASLEEARAYQFSEQERAFAEQQSKKYICGTPDRVRERILQMADHYDLDEVIAMMTAHNFQDRLESFRLLAASFSMAEV